jgi:uncharacterized protein YkwD
MLSAGVREEYLLELINQMRTDPTDELPLLLNSTNPNVQSALSYFQVNTTLLAQQWATLSPAPPLAYNDDMAAAALNHSELMNQLDEQSHQLPGEADLLTRITNAGYPASSVGENIYAFATDIFDAHAAFAIDWGNGPGGMESPPGHRQNIMDASFTDLGLGVLNGGGAGKSTGPVLVTEDFGSQTNPGNANLVGAVFTGTSADPFYSLSGEGTAQVTSNGMANVTITAVSSANPSTSLTATTTAAGGYQLQLPAGTYTVTFSGGSLTANMVKTVTVGAENVLLNINAAQQTPLPTNSEANTKYVTAVYQDVLGRAPDPNGLAYWVQQLDAGAPISSVAAAIGHSAEYYANFVIQPDYVNLLGRAADAAGVQYWTTQMLNGLTDQQLAAQLVASDEFYANAGGTTLGWIDAVYKLLLGRAADSAGESYWNNQLTSLLNTESAESARQQVAQGIAGSQENNTNLINADYMHYLGRAADPGGLTYWLQQFAGGATNEDVIAGFTGSTEYYNEHTS